MTARELFEAIGLVDEELIADADAPARRRWTQGTSPACAI